MKARTVFCVLIVFVSLHAFAQNPNYSAYYDYTVTYNDDGSATVIPTAEITGWDDQADWVIGGYRPLCNVRPKIQLTNDADWVLGTTKALYQVVDQVRTGTPV